MNGVAAIPNQIQDSIQSAFAAWNLGGRPWCESEGAETGDIREIQRLESPIVRNVEEHAVFFNDWRSVWVVCEHSVYQSTSSDEMVSVYSDQR